MKSINFLRNKKRNLPIRNDAFPRHKSNAYSAFDEGVANANDYLIRFISWMICPQFATSGIICRCREHHKSWRHICRSLLGRRYNCENLNVFLPSIATSRFWEKTRHIYNILIVVFNNWRNGSGYLIGNIDYIIFGGQDALRGILPISCRIEHFSDLFGKIFRFTIFISDNDFNRNFGGMSV